MYRAVVVPSARTVQEIAFVAFSGAYVGYLLFGYATAGVIRNLAVDYNSGEDFMYEAPGNTSFWL